MGFGKSLMKTLMFIFNGLVWILGIVLIIIGIVVMVEGQNWNDIIDGKTVPVSALLIVVGLVIAIIGFLGCCGAMKQNGPMLLIYAIALTIIILIQLVAGILAFIFSDQATEIVTEGLDKGMREYGASESYSEGIDYLQEIFECCGITDAADWSLSADKATYWINTGNHTNDTPDSCCVTITDNCGDGKAIAASADDDDINYSGCFTTLKDWIMDQGMTMGICGMVFIAFEFGAICVACLLKGSSD